MFSSRTIINTFCYIYLLVILCRADEEESKVGKFKIEGRVFPPENEQENWSALSRILVNGGEFHGYLREDGLFVINNVPSGSYLLEVTNPDIAYEPVRVDVNSKGKLRARKVNYLQTAAVHQVAYPLKMHPKGAFHYFQIREQWRVTDFLFSPMVLMMFLPLIVIMLLPKLMNAADPETQREMQMSLNMPKYDMPELSEVVTSFFAGGKKSAAPPMKSIKATKKR